MKFFIPSSTGSTHTVTTAGGGHLCVARGLPKKRKKDDAIFQIRLATRDIFAVREQRESED
jgi:hypothetical protein